MVEQRLGGASGWALLLVLVLVGRLLLDLLLLLLLRLRPDRVRPAAACGAVVGRLAALAAAAAEAKEGAR